MHIAPVLANTTNEAASEETNQTAQPLDLLLRGVLVRMRSKFTFFMLWALRYTRRIVGLKGEFCNRYILGRRWTPSGTATAATTSWTRSDSSCSS